LKKILVLYIMACTSGFINSILTMDDKKDPKNVVPKLLSEIEKKESCKGKNKYDMALAIIRNELLRKVNVEGIDANTKNRLNEVKQLIENEKKNEQNAEENEKMNQKNLDWARNYKEQLKSINSSVNMNKSSIEPKQEAVPKSPEELQEERAANIAAFHSNQPKKRKRFFGLFGGNKTRKSKKGINLCLKKSTKKCTKVRGCKIASGTKRTYCRKKKNHTKKSHTK